jgi:dihydroorotase
MHLHFRQDAMLRHVAPLSAQSFAGGVIMPNLVPPVDSLERLLWYTDEVKRSVEPYDFQPYMTLFMREYDSAELEAVRPHILGIKLYPAGATTNSDAGVREIGAMDRTFKIMEELGIPLLVHGETHGFVMDREREFGDIYRHLAATYPSLRITMEHITTADSVRLLDEFDNLFATITAHHLVITLDDVVGGMMDPHLFCKPIAKRPEDRTALLEAATRVHPKVMMGSDSAPHPVHAKESAGCAAGVFTAPFLLPLLAQIFDQGGALDRLQTFVSDNAQRIYGVRPPEKEVILIREQMRIADRYGDVVPMWAGQSLDWSFRS